LRQFSNSYRFVGLILVVIVLVVCFAIPMLTTLIFAESINTSIDEMNNEVAKKMRQKFDEECPKEKRAGYASKRFRASCDRAFDDADKNGNGQLTLNELKAALQSYWNKDPTTLELYRKAFDDNGDEQIDKNEYFELMKYLEFSSHQDAGGSEKTAGADTSSGIKASVSQTVAPQRMFAELVFIICVPLLCAVLNGPLWQLKTKVFQYIDRLNHPVSFLLKHPYSFYPAFLTLNYLNPGGGDRKIVYKARWRTVLYFGGVANGIICGIAAILAVVSRPFESCTGPGKAYLMWYIYTVYLPVGVGMAIFHVGFLKIRWQEGTAIADAFAVLLCVVGQVFWLIIAAQWLLEVLRSCDQGFAVAPIMLSLFCLANGILIAVIILRLCMFAYVNYDSKEFAQAYIGADFGAKQYASEPLGAEAAEKVSEWIVNAKEHNVRKGPSRTTDVIEKIKRGSKVRGTPTGGSSEWLKLEGDHGYVLIFEGATHYLTQDASCTSRLPVEGDKVRCRSFEKKTVGSWVLEPGEEAVVMEVGGGDNEGHFKLRNQGGMISEQFLMCKNFVFVEGIRRQDTLGSWRGYQ
jgi:uncharacterized protein YgiM (DUF1202 family)